MLRITVFHKVCNDAPLELADVDEFISMMKLRQFRWLEKLNHMPRTRIPCQLFGGWVIEMINSSNQLRARPFQTITHWIIFTLISLGISKDYSKFIQGLTGIINQLEEWAERVEEKLGSKKEHKNGTIYLDEAMIIAAAVLEQAIEILSMEPDTATYVTVNTVIHVMTFMIGQTSENYVDIYRTVSFHQKPMLLWKL